jgi:putative membrane protein
MKPAFLCGLMVLVLSGGGFAGGKAYVPSEKDLLFVKTAGQAGLGEMKVAELGVQRAADHSVKEFASLLVKDHGSVNQELKALADLKGIPFLVTVAPETLDTIKAMEKKSGKDFDKAFVEEMKKRHDKDIKIYEAAEKEIADPEIKAFIDKTLPVLRTHAEMLKKL